MRCTCCNRILSDYEATLRHAVTNDFLDICSKCLDGLGIPVLDREDLRDKESIVDDVEEDYVTSDRDESLPEVS